MKKLNLYLFTLLIIIAAAFYLKAEDTGAGKKGPGLAKDIKNYVNKLNSTSPASDQAFAKNQLIKLGQEAVPYLKEYLKNDKRTYIKVQITLIFGKMKDETLIPVLEETARTGKYPALCRSAITAIGEIGGAAALKSLENLKITIKDEALIKTIDETIKKVKKKAE